MQIEDIVTFWRGQQKVDDQGRWTHRLDRKVLDAGPQTFNLDHPVSPYVGDVLTAPVIILGANAKYDPTVTPSEFPNAAAVEAYVRRVDAPSDSDWSFVSSYYDDTNYGHLVSSGKAALINACAYRSPKLSEEANNRAMIKRLPSAVFTRRWLLEAVLPMAANGERLIVYYISENPGHVLPVGDEAIMDIVGHIKEISPTYRQHLHQPIDISLVCSKSFERDGRTPTTDNPFLLPIRLLKNDRGLMGYLPADAFWAMPSMIEARRYTHVEARFAPLHRGRGDLVSLLFGTSSRIDDMNRAFST